MFCAAGQQREEGAARRMRTSRAAVEPGGDAGAAERMLEESGIALRRADEDRHLVEAHAAARLLQDASRDLDAFTPFAGRGEELERAIGLARRWLQFGFEQETSQRREIAGSALLARLDRSSHLHERRARLPIAVRQRRQD